MTGIFNGLALKKEARLSVYLYLMTHSYLFIVPSHLLGVGVCGQYISVRNRCVTRPLFCGSYMTVSSGRNLLHLVGVEGQAESHPPLCLCAYEQWNARESLLLFGVQEKYNLEI